VRLWKEYFSLSFIVSDYRQPDAVVKRRSSTPTIIRVNMPFPVNIFEKKRIFRQSWFQFLEPILRLLNLQPQR
jgi:hypothetical protein